jgi:MFS family permease
VGIICGSFLVTRMTTHQVEIGLIPIGSAGLICSAVLAGLSNPAHGFFLVALFCLGLAGALFVVPLNAHLQEQVDPSRRGRILSANNLFVNLFGIVAVRRVGRVWRLPAAPTFALCHTYGRHDGLHYFFNAGGPAPAGAWPFGTHLLPGDADRA